MTSSNGRLPAATSPAISRGMQCTNWLRGQPPRSTSARTCSCGENHMSGTVTAQALAKHMPHGSRTAATHQHPRGSAGHLLTTREAHREREPTRPHCSSFLWRRHGTSAASATFSPASFSSSTAVSIGTSTFRLPRKPARSGTVGVTRLSLAHSAASKPELPETSGCQPGAMLLAIDRCPQQL